MLKFFPSSSIAGLHYFSCQRHLFRKEVNNVHPNVSAHAGVTLKKKTNKQSNEKNTVKPTMNVFKEIAVSGYLL